MFSVLWGTMFPIISEAVRGVKISVAAPFFNQVNIPLGLGLLFLAGVCPLIAWRKASVRNLRRNFLYPLSLSLVITATLYTTGCAARCRTHLFCHLLVRFWHDCSGILPWDTGTESWERRHGLAGVCFGDT